MYDNVTSGTNNKRKNYQTTGALIMEVADLLLPGLPKLLEGVRDADGIPLQPSHYRGIALNVAQALVKNADVH